MRQGTLGFVKERLVEARKARGFTTRKSLADVVGKNSSTIGRWEEGDSAPEPQSLREVARALNLRPAFFLEPIEDDADSPYFFRSLSSSLKRDKGIQQGRMLWLQSIGRELEKYVNFPNVNIPNFMGSSSFKQLRDEDIEQIACDLRSHWNLGDGPLINIIGHLEKNGFIVASEEMGTSKLDGLCRWGLDGRPYVLLASDKMSYARRQMDAAHEMGHAILHRNVSNVELSENFKLIEKQAFRLASAFLLPQSSYPLEVAALTLSELETKKERWRVSIKAQIMRLKSLDIIDQDYYVHMNKIYSSRRWAGVEPFDKLWPLEKPKLLKQAFFAITDASIKTRQQLLNEDFSLSSNDIESLAGLPSGWFHEFSSNNIVSLKAN